MGRDEGLEAGQLVGEMSQGRLARDGVALEQGVQLVEGDESQGCFGGGAGGDGMGAGEGADEAEQVARAGGGDAADHAIGGPEDRDAAGADDPGADSGLAGAEEHGSDGELARNGEALELGEEMETIGAQRFSPETTRAGTRNGRAERGATSPSRRQRREALSRRVSISVCWRWRTLSSISRMSLRTVGWSQRAAACSS